MLFVWLPSLTEELDLCFHPATGPHGLKGGPKSLFGKLLIVVVGGSLVGGFELFVGVICGVCVVGGRRADGRIFRDGNGCDAVVGAVIRVTAVRMLL